MAVVKVSTGGIGSFCGGDDSDGDDGDGDDGDGDDGDGDDGDDGNPPPPLQAKILVENEQKNR